MPPVTVSAFHRRDAGTARAVPGCLRPDARTPCGLPTGSRWAARRSVGKFARTAALARPALAEFLVSGGEVGEVGLIAVTRHPRPARAPRRAADHAPGPRRRPAARHPRHAPRPASTLRLSLRQAQHHPRSPGPHRHPDPEPRPESPDQERPRTRKPGAISGPLPCSHNRLRHIKIIYRPPGNMRRPTRGFGSVLHGHLASADAACRVAVSSPDSRVP
jgi:hypothetical protein